MNTKNKPIHRAADIKREASHPDWGTYYWIAEKEVGNSEHLSMGRGFLEDGKAHCRHAHLNCEQVMYVIKGQIEHSLGEEIYLLNEGDAIHIPAGVMHHCKAVNGDAQFINAYSSAERETVNE